MRIFHVKGKEHEVYKKMRITEILRLREMDLSYKKIATGATVEKGAYNDEDWF
jgi:hypothetical protein